MLIGCCIDLFRYDTLAACGFDSITLAAKDVVEWDEETFRSAQKKLKDGPLKTISLNSFCTPGLRLNGSGFDLAAVEAYTRRVCQRGSRLGFRMIGIGAPASRSLRPGDALPQCREQFKHSLSVMCRVARDYGMEILLESVCSLECNFITTTLEALQLLRELKEPNLHLVYDIYHEYMENQPLSVIAEAAEEIRVVHIAQNVDNRRAYLHADQAEIYRAYWDALKNAGYTGEWSLECFEGDPKQQIPASMEIIRHLGTRSRDRGVTQ